MRVLFNDNIHLIYKTMADKTPSKGLILMGTERGDGKYIPGGSELISCQPHLTSGSCYFIDGFNIKTPEIITADIKNGFIKFLYQEKIHIVEPKHMDKGIYFNDFAKKIRVLGHPIMIGDLISYLQKNSGKYENFLINKATYFSGSISTSIGPNHVIPNINKDLLHTIYTGRVYKTQPIEYQPEEFIKFVLFLIGKQKND